MLILDLVFVVFTLIFILTAFLRGFVKEIFLLFNWVTALLMSYFLAPLVSSLFKSSSIKGLVIYTVIGSVIFIATLIITSLSTSGLVKSLRSITPSSIDKSLGIFYGIIKTLLIFGVLYAVILNLFSAFLGTDKNSSIKESPDWLTNAKSYNIIRYSGELVDPIVESFFNSTYKDMQDKIKDMPLNDLGKKMEDIATDKIESESKILIEEAVKDKNLDDEVGNPGYKKQDIENMRRLMDILSK